MRDAENPALDPRRPQDALHLHGEWEDALAEAHDKDPSAAVEVVGGDFGAVLDSQLVTDHSQGGPDESFGMNGGDGLSEQSPEKYVRHGETDRSESNHLILQPSFISIRSQRIPQQLYGSISILNPK